MGDDSGLVFFEYCDVFYVCGVWEYVYGIGVDQGEVLFVDQIVGIVCQ